MAKVWLITGSGNGLSDGIPSLTSPCGYNSIFRNERGESANSGAVGPRRVRTSFAIVAHYYLQTDRCGAARCFIRT